MGGFVTYSPQKRGVFCVCVQSFVINFRLCSNLSYQIFEYDISFGYTLLLFIVT